MAEQAAMKRIRTGTAQVPVVNQLEAPDDRAASLCMLMARALDAGPEK